EAARARQDSDGADGRAPRHRGGRRVPRVRRVGVRGGPDALRRRRSHAVSPWLALALVLLAHIPAGAQTPTDEAARVRVDEVVRTTMADRHFPSAVVAVVRDSGIVNAAAYGQMRLRDAEPATPQTVYRLDSVTKQFTAAGIMLLVQDGGVDLDARVKRYLPAAPASWDEITIRRLLTHTSGLA